jgi:hypothetical protein
MTIHVSATDFVDIVTWDSVFADVTSDVNKIGYQFYA